MVDRLVAVWWLLTRVASGGGGGAANADSRVSERIHGDAIFDTSSFMDETERRRLFEERHGQWPDPRWVARELPTYTAAMAAREKAVMALSDSQARWDAWMFLAQARLLDNFTATQREVVAAPRDVWERLHRAFHEALAKAPQPEASTGSGVHGPTRPDFLAQEALNYQILDELQPFHEAWCGCELEPTSVYGVRVYREGSTLVDHLDVPETHVISSILHIDSDLDAPFPLEIEDATGTYAAVDLKPGQMCFYESAKAFHRRSIPMRGRYYGSLFLHYRPKSWTFTREQVRLAIPPYWGDALQDPPQREDPVVVAPPKDAATVLFRLEPDDDDDDDDVFPTADSAVTISWVDRDDENKDVAMSVLDVSRPTYAANTFIGHTWRATTTTTTTGDYSSSSSSSLEIARWTVTRADHAFVVRVPPRKQQQPAWEKEL